ncbi:hypothetical protein [Rhodococcus kronopolitis]|uniref:Cytochrome aa3 subunit 4 n=1 Tax=Rhodococcus kronopolitis TaxID=1460226 RepID=A0ABV9FV04_9NOCA
MARGDHPQRTPFYGILFVFAAMALFIVTATSGPTWFAVGGYILAVLFAIFGFMLTFRDLSGTRPGV